MLSLDLVNQFYNYKWWKLFLFLPLKSQVVWESRETDRICLRTARAHWNKSPSISAKPWFVLFKHFPNPDFSSSIILNALICPLQLHQMLWFVIFNYLNSADLSCSIIWYAPSSPLKLSQMVWFALFYYLKWYFFLFNYAIWHDLFSFIISNVLICPLQLSPPKCWLFLQELNSSIFPCESARNR